MGSFHRDWGKYLGRCQVAQGLVGTLGVIETEVVTDPDPGISSTLMCLQQGRVGEMKWNPPPQMKIETVGFAALHPPYPLRAHHEWRAVH